MQYEKIAGGIAAPEGFVAGGIHCGIRKNKLKPDLAMVLAQCSCAAAAVYTQNKVQGAPIVVTKRNLADGKARAILCNSGNANTCNPDGEQVAQACCKLAAQALGIAPEEVVIASTGVIGQPLPLEPFEQGIPKLAAGLSKQGGAAACEAIMTTDLAAKELAIAFPLGGKTCRMAVMAKGSGMIHPNMATMLAFLTTDVAISSEMLAKALKASVELTYNMVSVDGDTSTNDMVTILASGLAGNPTIEHEGPDYTAFLQALQTLNLEMARRIAADGEGATKLLLVKVQGAADAAAAKAIAKSVCASSLFKTAMFGADANWGRVLCAIGYAGAPVDVTKVGVSFESAAGHLAVCSAGAGLPFDEAAAKAILSENEVTTHITLGDGTAAATAFGCDLTYDYVKINGDYRT